MEFTKEQLSELICIRRKKTAYRTGDFGAKAPRKPMIISE